MINRFLAIGILLLIIIAGLIIYQKANLANIKLNAPQVKPLSTPLNSPSPTPTLSPQIEINSATDLPSLNKQSSPEDFSPDFENLKKEVSSF